MKKSIIPYLMGLILAVSLHSNTIRAQEKRGYEKTLEAGYSIGYGYLSNNTFNFHMVNGYRWDRYLFLGVGTGFSYSNLFYGLSGRYTDLKQRDDALMIPLYGQVKINFGTATISPYLSMNVGYMFDVTREEGDAGGLLWQPNAGISYRVDEDKRVFFQLGFNMHRYHYDIHPYETYYSGSYTTPTSHRHGIPGTSHTFKAIDMRFGLQF